MVEPVEQPEPYLRRAAAAGQSVQAYLLAGLVEEASHPSVDEVLARAVGRDRGSVSLDEAVATLRSERTHR